MRTITILVFIIITLSILVTTTGIYSIEGPGPFEYETIRQTTVTIYGKGVYRDMSADVAIQGIAQDYVTLFIGVPLLVVALFGSRKGLLKSRLLLAGTLGYFFVTYLFYATMGMYNVLFLAYVALLSASFFAMVYTFFSFDTAALKSSFSPQTPVKSVGGFLIFNAVCIALLWLSIVIPPLIEGTIYPLALEHYTTLIVQGLDLGLLLPIAFVTGVMLIRKKPFGYLFGTAYIVFLSILMTALSAKIIAMALNHVNVIPAVFIIPVFNVCAIAAAVVMITSVREVTQFDNDRLYE